MSTATQTTRSSPLALFQLPAPAALTDAQLRGAHCVWCAAELHGDTAVSLEPRHDSIKGVSGRWYPRGCRSCTLKPLLLLVRTHPGECEQCTDDASLCETRRALRALALELHR
ncbi:hypothetical protein ACF07Y_33915 [Streptomyces sp. NPDC016566]|uniref:hypothetical protein n=1 Tax=Streptomyces sp. NPDC016566 TaxID=3364967 RepID=UPI0037034622